MTATPTKTDKLHFDNEIGIVSDSRVIIHKGKASDVIRIDAIKKINLIKKRRFELNFLFMLAALSFALVLFYSLHLELVVKLLFLALIGAAIVMGISYKSYLYQVRINLKDEKTFIIRAHRYRKQQLKFFYYSIRRKLRTNSFDK